MNYEKSIKNTSITIEETCRHFNIIIYKALNLLL